MVKPGTILKNDPDPFEPPLNAKLPAKGEPEETVTTGFL
jgi:hypothetical protein